MPLYDFKCPQGHVNEKLVKRDTEHIPCPDCQEVATRQVSAPGGYQLLGGGYYETDFKTPKNTH